jgi:hypothetical protein
MKNIYGMDMLGEAIPLDDYTTEVISNLDSELKHALDVCRVHHVQCAVTSIYLSRSWLARCAALVTVRHNRETHTATVFATMHNITVWWNNEETGIILDASTDNDSLAATVLAVLGIEDCCTVSTRVVCKNTL